MALPYMKAGMIWGDACTEVLSGRTQVWDCSHFVLRMIRDILQDQSFGRGASPLNCVARDMFQNLSNPQPDELYGSWPIIGLADKTGGAGNYWNIVHIAFLLSAGAYKSTGSLIVDPRSWIVLDMVGTGTGYPVAIHNLTTWFSAGESAALNVPFWFAGRGDAQPAPQYAWVVGQYLSEARIRQAVTSFLPADRNNFRAIP